MLISEGQRDEAVLLIKLGLMHTPQSPLPRPFEAAAGTPAARKKHRICRIKRLERIEGHQRLPALSTFERAEGLQRGITGHGLQPNATAHRCTHHVLRMDMTGPAAKVCPIGPLGHLVTLHFELSFRQGMGITALRASDPQ